MKIKVDENLPQNLAEGLTALGHDVKSVYDENLSGCADDELWKAVQVEKRFLITQDLDFSDIRKFAPGTHAGVLLIRLRNPSRAKLFGRVCELFKQENVTDWGGCFVIATERKVRVVRD